jgi:GNAT superfamily N-acetyltransferase
VLSRVRDVVRRHGLRGVAHLAVDRVGPRQRVAAVYVWYAIDLERADRPQNPLPEGFVVREATIADVASMQQMTSAHTVTITEEVMRERVLNGVKPWLAISDDGRVAALSWVFTRSLPLRGRYELVLPDDVAGFEDTVTSREMRGRGIAPALLTQLGDILPRDGVRAIITRIDVENAASHRAVQKLGFEECARMRVVTRDWRTIVQMVVPPGDRSYAWMTGQVERTRSPNPLGRALRRATTRRDAASGSEPPRER